MHPLLHWLQQFLELPEQQKELIERVGQLTDGMMRLERLVLELKSLEARPPKDPRPVLQERTMKKTGRLADEDSGLLTVAQACRFLKVSKKKLYKLDREGLIEMRKLGHTTVITEASLRRLINELPQRAPR
jgi:excisionase family DNA binding protein